MSKRPRLKPEQIVAKPREIEVKLSQGKEVKAACREAGTTDKSYYRWRREFGGMKVDQFFNAGHNSTHRNECLLWGTNANGS